VVAEYHQSALTMTDFVADRLRRISSRQNGLVRELRRAFAQGEATEDGYCAIESFRIIEEAIRSGLKFKAVFFSTSAEARSQRLLPQLAKHVETLVLADDVFAAAVATQSPQGVAALVKLRETSLEQMLAAAEPLIVVVSGVQDPGNLGAMLRSAEAFEATGAILTAGTVAPFNPKVVRASAGSLFRLPLAQSPDLIALLAELRSRGVRLVATSSHKGTPLSASDLAGPLALLVGNEGAGLPRDVLREMDDTVVIPHSPRVESLNAAVAASIMLYEIARRRQA
jgi:TrmH family RNA methyltransferase